MKWMHLCWITLLFVAGCAPANSADEIKAAARRVESGKAVLVDVREPSEWAQTGVALPAQLLSKSSFDTGSSEWRNFLERNKDKEIILMCRSGNRSGQIARVLAKQGLTVTNLGGFSGWKDSGLPTRSVP